MTSVTVTIKIIPIFNSTNIQNQINLKTTTKAFNLAQDLETEKRKNSSVTMGMNRMKNCLSIRPPFLAIWMKSNRFTLHRMKNSLAITMSNIARQLDPIPRKARYSVNTNPKNMRNSVTIILLRTMVAIVRWWPAEEKNQLTTKNAFPRNNWN